MHFNLAARKLPKTAIWFSNRPLSKKNLILALQYSSDRMHNFHISPLHGRKSASLFQPPMTLLIFLARAAGTRFITAYFGGAAHDGLLSGKKCLFIFTNRDIGILQGVNLCVFVFHAHWIHCLAALCFNLLNVLLDFDFKLA